MMMTMTLTMFVIYAADSVYYILFTRKPLCYMELLWKIIFLRTQMSMQHNLSQYPRFVLVDIDVRSPLGLVSKQIRRTGHVGKGIAISNMLCALCRIPVCMMIVMMTTIMLSLCLGRRGQFSQFTFSHTTMIPRALVRQCPEPVSVSVHYEPEEGVTLCQTQKDNERIVALSIGRSVRKATLSDRGSLYIHDVAACYANIVDGYRTRGLLSRRYTRTHDT